MSFTTNLDKFFTTRPQTADLERGTELASQVLRAATQAARKVLDLTRKAEAAHNLPADQLLATWVRSGHWRGLLPPRDGDALAAARDVLLEEHLVPAIRAPGSSVDADELGAALSDLGREARRALVAQVLRVLVDHAQKVGATPRSVAQQLATQIAHNPRVFANGDLTYRLLDLLLG